MAYNILSPAFKSKRLIPSRYKLDSAGPSFSNVTFNLGCSFSGDHQNTTNLILDHETFWMNLTESNQLGSDSHLPFKIRLEYSARVDYGLKDLSPKSWYVIIFMESKTKMSPLE